MLERSIPLAIDFSPDALTQVPAAPAIYLVRQGEGEPYLGKTSNLRRRLWRLLASAGEGSKRLNLRLRATGVEYSLTGSEFESTLLLYKTLKVLFPASYQKRLRLRFAPLIRIRWENAYPRAYVTRRITLGRRKSMPPADGAQPGFAGPPARASVYYGPFPSQAAAERFLNDALDQFKSRRCTFELHPDPEFPGCIYSEMKMCLAPCFKGCTDEQYFDEVARVQAYFDSGGESLRKSLSADREAASLRMDFEAAALLHARLEKAGATRTPDIVRRIDRLHGLILQPPATKDFVTMFRIHGGMIGNAMQFPLTMPELLSPSSAGSTPSSMEGRLKQFLSEAPALHPASALELMEHLALLKRWHYRTLKTGEIFLADGSGQLPFRRIVRGISRVVRGEKPEVAVAAAGEIPES